MGKDRLEDFSLDKLKKRKKFGVGLLFVLVCAAILDIIVLLVNFIREKHLDTPLLGVASGCLVCALVLYLGIKKTDGEISRRKSQ